MFLPRQIRLDRLQPGPQFVELVCTSGGRFSVCAAPRLPAVATGTVTGSAQALLLLLWKRTTVADPRLTVSGDLLEVERLFAQPLTP